MFDFHDPQWGMWSSLLDTNYGFVKMQVRKCKCCNRIDIRHITLKHQATADSINKALEAK